MDTFKREMRHWDNSQCKFWLEDLQLELERYYTEGRCPDDDLRWIWVAACREWKEVVHYYHGLQGDTICTNDWLVDWIRINCPKLWALLEKGDTLGSV